MNVKIASYITFEGAREELTPLLDDIADALVKHGFGNNEADDPDLHSMITVGESGLSKCASADEFARMIVYDPDTFTVIIPTKEEPDVSGD